LPAMHAFLSISAAGCSSFKVPEIVSRFSMPCLSCLWANSTRDLADNKA
jgi:hypothetical protein